MLGFIIRETFRAIRKAKLFFVISLFTMAIGIFLIQASFLLSRYIEVLKSDVARSLVVQVFLEDGISGMQLENLRKELGNHALVGKTAFISKERAESLFVKETGEDFRKVLDYNPLPASFSIVLKSEQADVGSVERFIQWAQKLQGVQDIGFEKSVYQRMLNFFIRAEKYIFSIAAVLTLIAFYIIFSMSVVLIGSREEEIRIMRLVGSSRILVGAPIIGNGLLVGVLASGMTFWFWWILIRTAKSTSMIPSMDIIDLPLAAKGTAIGLGICLLSSLLALLRLHKKTN